MTQILVWFLPRSASTSYVHQLSTQSGIETYNEIFGYWRDDEYRNEVLGKDDWIIKVNSLQYHQHKNQIDALLETCEVQILEPRSFIESYTSWILPATIMNYTDDRDLYWNIHWYNQTSEEMKANYDGYLMTEADAFNEINNYSKLVDDWIKYMPLFLKKGTVIRQNELLTTDGKIWDDWHEKAKYIRNPELVLEEIANKGTQRWNKIKTMI